MSKDIDWDKVISDLHNDLKESYDPALAALCLTENLTEEQISHLESLADVLEDNIKLGEMK